MSHVPEPRSTEARTPVPSKDEPTIGKLVADASRDVSSLVKNEIALAKSELQISVKAGGIGIGLFAAAAFIGVLAIIMLSIAILAFVGLRKVKQVKAPERAIHQAQESRNILKRG